MSILANCISNHWPHPVNLRRPTAYGAAWRWLAALAVLLMLFSSRAQASYTIVDSGSNQTFTAPAAGAIGYAWTLDGSSVGTNNSTFTYAPDQTAVGTHDLIVQQTLATGGTTAAEWGVQVNIPIPASTIQYYVSVTGTDTNNGSIGAPFGTLEGALNAIRALPRPLRREG